MHADKTMWDAMSAYLKNTFTGLRSWYFGNEAPRYLTLPLFAFAVLVALSIVAYIPATITSLYRAGGLFLLLLGVGPALIFLLIFAAVFYLSLPRRLHYALKGRVASPAVCYLLVVAAMVACWVAVGFLQLGYSYFIRSVLASAH